MRNVFACVPIAGITRFTTVDFPGRLAAVFYTRGCPWRCRYCHNHELQEGKRSAKDLQPETIGNFLFQRKGLLDGIVLCGGEPLMHDGLFEFMKSIRNIGFEMALHTGGMFPKRLKKILTLCDWVGMDIKAPLHKYDRVTQTKNSATLINESVDIVVNSGVDYEFRTTVHSLLLSDSDISNIAVHLAGRGAKTYAIQRFVKNGCKDKSLTCCESGKFSSKLMNKLKAIIPNLILR